MVTPRLAGSAIVAVAVLGYAWWATGLAPFTDGILVAVLAGGVVAVAVGWRQRRLAPTGVRPDGAGLSPGARRRPAAVVWWAALVVALAGWELASYVQDPREEHPTISHLLNIALETHPVRAAAFAAWLAGAWWIGRR